MFSSKILFFLIRKNPEAREASGKENSMQDEN